MSSGSENSLSDIELESLEELNEKGEEELSDEEVTSKVRLSVKRRFEAPTWATVFEFQNRDGKRADCLAFNTQPSRGFKLVGFEFKASRSDWLAEKRDHEKADLFVQFCDEWYVVAGRRGIVEEDELPSGWGLFELKPSGQLWKLVESELSDLQDRSLDRRFYARFIRKAIGNESNFSYADLREAKRRGYDEAMDEAVEEHIDYETEKLQEKAESWDKLQESDLDLPWRTLSDERVQRLNTAQNIVQAVQTDRFQSFERDLSFLQDDIDRKMADMLDLADGIESALDDLRASLKEVDDE